MSHFEAELQIAVAESFLASLEMAIVNRLIQRARAWAISAGRVFVDASHPSRCGLIVSGHARVYAMREDGAQVTVRRVGRGGAVGVRAMTGCPNGLSVVAMTDLEFLEFDTALLLPVARREASLAWAIAQEVTMRLCDTETMLERDPGNLIRTRVAATVLELAADASDGTMALSQEAFAELIGASRESVGRSLRDLEADGLIRRGRRRLEIVNPAGLAAAATAEGHPRQGAGGRTDRARGISAR